MQKKWWHGKIAYQIYPKSFMDSNGDGIGDLKGILSKLPYLKHLGVDIIWISPIYVSPFIDQGYDVADYQNIDPIFGSMEDFDELLAAAKALDMDIIMDLVVNHCSSEHQWFKKACADLQSPEAGYFYFVKGRNGGTPDNLRSYFGGSVWEKVPGHENEDLYYLHYFAKQQPDLNWSNPALREEIYKMVNWWLDKGIAGFRIDAIHSAMKDLTFPGLPPDDIDGMCHASKMNARMFSKLGIYLKELHERTFKPHDAFTVGEAFAPSPEVLQAFVGDDGYFSSLFDLSCREVIEAAPSYMEYQKLTVKQFRDCIFGTQMLYNYVGMSAPIIENHDEPRGVTYFMPDYLNNAAGARAIATVHMLLRGIPFIYQGQELGMTNTRFDSISEHEDLFAHDEYNKAVARGWSDQEALALCNLHGRDNARTPMLWDDSANAGFTSGTPWMKIHQDYRTLNVKAQYDDANSVFNYYRSLIALRKSPEHQQCLTYGRFAPVEVNDEVIAYRRCGESETILVVVNTAKEDLVWDLHNEGRLLLSCNKAETAGSVLTLGCGGGAVLSFPAGWE